MARHKHTRAHGVGDRSRYSNSPAIKADPPWVGEEKKWNQPEELTDRWGWGWKPREERKADPWEWEPCLHEAVSRFKAGPPDPVKAGIPPEEAILLYKREADRLYDVAIKELDGNLWSVWEWRKGSTPLRGWGGLVGFCEGLKKWGESLEEWSGIEVDLRDCVWKAARQWARELELQPYGDLLGYALDAMSASWECRLELLSRGWGEHVVNPHARHPHLG